MNGDIVPGRFCSKCGGPLRAYAMDVGYVELICLDCDNSGGGRQMNPNEDPTFLCPYCSVRFHVDQNGGDLQHCPTCGQLLNVRGEVERSEEVSK